MFYTSRSIISKLLTVLTMCTIFSNNEFILISRSSNGIMRTVCVEHEMHSLKDITNRQRILYRHFNSITTFRLLTLRIYYPGVELIIIIIPLEDTASRRVKRVKWFTISDYITVIQCNYCVFLFIQMLIISIKSDINHCHRTITV